MRAKNEGPDAVLALDLGTRTGWAAGEIPCLGGAGTWDLAPHRHQSEAMRYVVLRRHIGQVLAGEGVEGWCDFRYVVYEDLPFRQKSTRAGQIWGGLAAIVMELAESRGLEWIGIPPAAIKRHAAGKGNVRKDVMVATAREKWKSISIVDDNQADAMWLWSLFVEEYI